jgi:hypothetical protein
VLCLTVLYYELWIQTGCNPYNLQRQWQHEFITDPPMWLTIAHICDKFEADGIVYDVHKYLRPCTALMLEQFTWWPQMSTKQCAYETGISRSRVEHILKCAQWKFTSKGCYMPWMKSAVLWVVSKQGTRTEFISRIIRFDEATFKLSGTVNHHKYVYWAPENLCILVDKAVN